MGISLFGSDLNVLLDVLSLEVGNLHLASALVHYALVNPLEERAQLLLARHIGHRVQSYLAVVGTNSATLVATLTFICTGCVCT